MQTLSENTLKKNKSKLLFPGERGLEWLNSTAITAVQLLKNHHCTTVDERVLSLTTF